jgi:hypothetical protein
MFISMKEMHKRARSRIYNPLHPHWCQGLIHYLGGSVEAKSWHRYCIDLLRITTETS